MSWQLWDEFDIAIQGSGRVFCEGRGYWKVQYVVVDILEHV